MTCNVAPAAAQCCMMRARPTMSRPGLYLSTSHRLAASIVPQMTSLPLHNLRLHCLAYYWTHPCPHLLISAAAPPCRLQPQGRPVVHQVRQL